MRSHGLTLVELIVALSIVATLAAILLPATHGAREQARQIQCQSHIHDLLLEFQQYHQSEDGFLPYGLEDARFPPSRRWAGDPSRDMMGCWWFDFLEAANHTSLRDCGIVTCPSKRVDRRGLARNVLWGNYGVNRALCIRTASTGPGRPPRDPALPVAAVRHPGSTLLVLDSGHALASWYEAVADPPTRSELMISLGIPYIPGLTINRDRLLDPDLTTDAIQGRHLGRTINRGFADGHADRAPADRLLVTRTGEDTYTNRSPLWEPQTAGPRLQTVGPRL